LKRVRKSKANLVIKEHNPWKFFLWLVIAMIIVSVGFALSFEMGYIQGDMITVKAYRNIKDHEDLVKVMNSQVKVLNRDNSRLRTATARLESQSRINSHANRKVRFSLIRLQKENLNLREELDFYRNIISPNKKFSGLKIHSFKVDQGAEKGLYYYKLTLVKIHGLRNRHRKTKGEVRVYISGRKLDGTSGILTLKDITSVKKSRLKFTIKYLLRLEGRMSLPAGFLPNSVRVQVIPTKRRGLRGNSIEKRIKWPFKTS